jgi:hypothetical protein
MPTAWAPSATTSSVGRLQVRLSPAQSTADGTAASPTMIQALLPSMVEAVRSIAATRNVPAIM